MSYTSEHQSLALLEYFVHIDKDDPPADLVLAVADVPGDLPREQIDLSRLPANWKNPIAPPELARIGNEFVQRRDHCLLLVPSVLTSSEWNWLINPDHSDYKRIIVCDLQPVSYDPRMFEKTSAKRRRSRL